MLVDDHLPHQPPQQALALDGRGRRRLPERRQVFGQRQDRRAVDAAQHQPLLPQVRVRLLLDLLQRPQLLLPLPRQGPRHQPVLRLHRIKLPPGALGRVAGAFHPQLPLPAYVPFVLLQLCQGREGNGQLIRGQRRQHQPLDRGVEAQATAFLAGPRGPIARAGEALVDRKRAQGTRVE